MSTQTTHSNSIAEVLVEIDKLSKATTSLSNATSGVNTDAGLPTPPPVIHLSADDRPDVAKLEEGNPPTKIPTVKEVHGETVTDVVKSQDKDADDKGGKDRGSENAEGGMSNLPSEDEVKDAASKVAKAERDLLAHGQIPAAERVEVLKAVAVLRRVDEAKRADLAKSMAKAMTSTNAPIYNADGPGNPAVLFDQSLANLVKDGKMGEVMAATEYGWLGGMDSAWHKCGICKSMVSNAIEICPQCNHDSLGRQMGFDVGPMDARVVKSLIPEAPKTWMYAPLGITIK
jgi:hypothetical protein